MTVLGYTVKEIQDMGENLVSILMHPEDFNIYVRDTLPRYQILEDGEWIEHEYRMKHADGTWRWLHSKESIFLREADGTPKQIFGVVSDITDRKQAEARIRESEQQYRTLVEAIPNTIIAKLDNNGKLIYMNLETTASITGRLGDGFNTFGERLEEVHPEDYDWVAAATLEAT